MKKKIFVYMILAVFLFSIFASTISASNIRYTKKFIKTDVEKIYSYDNTNTDLPTNFSWRDIDGVDFTTPIRNQAPFASCETFALTAALEVMVQYQVGYPFGCDLSEAHLYFYSGGNFDWGSYPENDTKVLVESGIPDEACWPYPKVRKVYPLNTTSPDWQERVVKIKNWSYLPEGPIAIKNALINNGPVPTYFHVYKDFLSHKDGIYRHRWGESRGPHYVTIMGYNDDPGYWIVKNSWGTEYQDNGWFNIAYGECEIEKKSFLLTGVYGQFPILYVDDDNTAGPWNGTLDHPYLNIQDAIDNAYVGYTIFVCNGTYSENLVINKTINLDGENVSNTIIDGSNIGDVIEVSAPGVRVSGFTVQNSGTSLFNAGIKTLSLDSNITIKNNIIQNNDIGIFLNYAYEESRNVVKDNLVQNNRQGIYVHWANNNNIENNIIQNNTGEGIEMVRCRDGFIVNNLIIDNDGVGIFLRGASNKNKIQKNEIENNNIGIKLENSHKNFVNKNNFIDNDQQACFNNSYLNRWRRNYWNDWERIIPRKISGTIGSRRFPWINIDWSPVKQLH